MVDITEIRNDPQKFKIAAKQKGYEVDIDRLLQMDDSRRQIQSTIESLQQKRNELAAKAKGGKPTEEDIESGKELKAKIADIEAKLRICEEEFFPLYKAVPNLPLEDVPIGVSENDNVVSKTWGEKPTFDFEPKSHWQIAEERDLIDKNRAAKVSGSRFAYLKGPLVEIQFALIQFVLSQVTDKNVIAKIITDNNLKIRDNPFIPILPPVLIKEDVYDQMDRLEPREDRYKVESEEKLWLIGSAEHTLGSMFKDEILEEKNLPLRYIGYSTSFRQEAGTYGKDTEGIIRMHQFDKMEFEVFSTAETGLDEHLLLIALQEYLTQQLGLPYHVLNKCTADIGKPNARGVDVEMWMPGQDKYRETHTADYMTDYQSRRLQTRTRRKDGSIELIHTNDATAFAMGRTLVAIIENYQQKDGKIRLPKVLRNYMGGREEI